MARGGHRRGDRRATPVAGLRVDGGLTNDETLLALQADALGLPLTVGRADATVLGAAMLAGVGAGVFDGVEQAAERRAAGGAPSSRRRREASGCASARRWREFWCARASSESARRGPAGGYSTLTS